MKLCPECSSSPWPFAVVPFISTFVAFLTWLMLGFAGGNPTETVVGTALAFVATGGTVLHYVRCCIKRHCRHDGGQVVTHHHHHHGAMG
jgi:hypothetical protein